MNQTEKIHIYVVDDEPIGADDISDLIRDQFQEAWNVEVHTAYSAASVLKQTETQPCDILLSDIKMPGMTGLELASKMRERFPKLIIIFLTGFDDFSYAYEAYRQHAFHYLLKTEGDDVILDAVKKCLNTIRERRWLISRISDAETRYATILPDYRKQLLTQALHAGEGELEDESPYVPGYINLLMARFEKNDIPQTQKLVVLTAVQEIIAEDNPQILWSDHFLMEDGPLWLISTESENADVNHLFHLVRSIRKRIEDQLGLSLFFVISQKPVRYKGLSRLFRELQSMLRREILEGEAGAAIQHDNAASVPKDDHYWELKRYLELCRKDIEQKDAYLFRIHLQPLFDQITQYPETLVSEEIQSLLHGYVLHYITQNNLQNELSAIRAAHPHQNMQYYEAIADLIARETEKEKGNAVRSIADYVCRYIEEHISEDISMQVLSDASGYSTGYLARVFKQQEGVSIHDYITDKRISLAKAMLMGSNMRVYEIAARCGYENTAYFIKVFKLQTGQTPQDFKQNQPS